MKFHKLICAGLAAGMVLAPCQAVFAEDVLNDLVADVATDVPLVTPSVETILKEVVEAMDDATSMTGQLDASIVAAMGAQTEGMSMMVDLGMDIHAGFESLVNGSSHMTGDVVVTIGDETTDQSMEAYTDVSNGVAASYFNSGSGWEVTYEDDVTDENTVDDSVDAVVSDMLVSAENIEAQRETVDGMDMYHIYDTVSGETVAGVLDTFGTGFDGTEDYSGMSLSMDFYVDAATYFPTRLTFCLSQDSNPIRSVSADGTTEVTALSATMSFTGFNTLTEILIPDEVIAEAEANAEASEPTDEELESELQAMIDELPEDVEPSTSDQTDPVHELTSENGKYTAVFPLYDSFNGSYVADNFLSLYDSNYGAGSPEVTITFSLIGDTYFCAESSHKSALEYYNRDDTGMTETFVSELNTTNAGDYPVYWYKRQYTDEEFEYVSCDYEAYIELDDETSITFEVSSMTDIGAPVILEDDTFYDILAHLEIQQNG